MTLCVQVFNLLKTQLPEYQGKHCQMNCLTRAIVCLSYSLILLTHDPAEEGILQDLFQVVGLCGLLELLHSFLKVPKPLLQQLV